VGVPSEANPVLDDEDIARMRRNLPDGVVQQELDGQFVEIGSGVLQKDMLHYVQPDAIPERDMSIYVGVDLGVQASSTKAQQQDSDYWVAAVLAVDPVHKDGYLIDLHRERGMTLREGIQWLKGIERTVRGAEFIIESNQSQRFLTQEAESEGLRVTKIYNTDNKEDRLVQMSIPFSNKSVRLVDWGDDRFQPLVDEWLAFPEGSHDDTLDATEIAVSQANLGGGYNILEGEAYERDEDW
jgi:predicted phage terminase large subunit-like protein